MLSQHKELVASVFLNLLGSRCPLCVILETQTQIRVVSYTSPHGTSLHVLHCLTPLSSPPSSPPYLTSSFVACFFFRPSHLVIPQSTHLLQAWQDLFPPERLPLSTLELFPPHNIAPSPSVDRRLVLGIGRKKKAWYSQGTGLLWRNVLASALCLCN